jgi:hypothetical protein
VQKRIYQGLGGTREYDDKILDAFGDRVGWLVNKQWLCYTELKFNTKRPEGHLPRIVVVEIWAGGLGLLNAGSLFSRRDL